jgi:8-amino-7-oxononanoate synthase
LQSILAANQTLKILMKKVPKHITKTLLQLEENDALLALECPDGNIDFMSNDYLGVVKHQLGEETLPTGHRISHGATGSRLLAGNSMIHLEFEAWLADYYHGESALVFNSGFVANYGIVDALATRHDVILYDEWIHASLRDGCRISNAASYSFKHNDLEDLADKIAKHKNKADNIYVLIESLYSMDGDIPDIEAICKICDLDNVYLIVDEAHSTGIMGENGEGLIIEKGLEDKVFLRIYTFGKAIGRKGAVAVGDKIVIDFLINRCRSFIYSTALSPLDILRIQSAINAVKGMREERSYLQDLSDYANGLFSTIPGALLHESPRIG